MPFIAFIGCDGSGKSAIIQRVANQLQKDGVQVECGHWMPKSFSGKSQESADIPVDDPHGKPPRGLCASILKLGWMWLNWWVGWWQHLRSNSRHGLVLFDRFHGDLLADPLRYRYGGPTWLARIATRLMPQPDMVIFLDAPPDVLLSRKQEVSRDSLMLLRRNYLTMAKTGNGYIVIDSSQSLENVVDEVICSANRLIE